MYKIAILSLVVVFHSSYSQLVGHRGVVKLPEGFQYRDKVTVSASIEAANFAKQYQSNEKIKISNIERNDLLQTPKYVSQNINGTPQKEIFDFLTSRALQPFPENVFNIPLTEVELERLALLQKPRLLPDPVVEQQRIEEVRNSVDFKAKAFLKVTPELKSEHIDNLARLKGQKIPLKPRVTPKSQQLIQNPKVSQVSLQNVFPFPAAYSYPNLLFSYSLHR